ncbi:MAG TPA: alpha/beta hydrolase [Gemmatimonadaceae bacterium]|jgi:pimeloyl-ACP methyl ester carboxylesterase
MSTAFSDRHEASRIQNDPEPASERELPNNADFDRRDFLSVLAAGFAGMNVGIRHLSSPEAAEAMSATTLATHSRARPPLGPVKQINAGLLNIGYVDVGPANGHVVILLHGWPYDIQSYAEVAPILASSGYRVIIPHLRGYGSTHFLSATTVRNGEQAALAVDLIALMDALKIDHAVIAGFDWGARTADIVAALWPRRCKALVSVSGYLIGSQASGKTPLPPAAELQWWYQYYFATDRGRAGYDKYRHDFAKLIWQTASPKWRFDDATFDRSAASFLNADHVAIVIHNYRWRLGLANGESAYAGYEAQLAKAPTISVPTITLEGDANGAPHADAAAYANKFAARYEHRVIAGGIGHNLPQEAPKAFAKAVVDVDGF